jgi:glycine hydroxymethyltransferase
VVGGGTDVRVTPVDLRESPLHGKIAEDLLHEIGIIVNRNAVPTDPRPPMVRAGVGAAPSALAIRTSGDVEFREVADSVANARVPTRLGRCGSATCAADAAGHGILLYVGLEGRTLVDR